MDRVFGSVVRGERRHAAWGRTLAGEVSGDVAVVDLLEPEEDVAEEVAHLRTRHQLQEATFCDGPAFRLGLLVTRRADAKFRCCAFYTASQYGQSVFTRAAWVLGIDANESISRQRY